MLKGQKICTGCKERFFVDEEFDIIKGLYYCSHCQDRLVQCCYCEELKVGGPKSSFVMTRRTKKKESGYICSDCREQYSGFGTAWQALRFKVFRRDYFTCRYCGASPLKDVSVKLHCDHIETLSTGGESRLNNLITACADCNLGKGTTNLKDDEVLSLTSRQANNGNCV